MNEKSELDEGKILKIVSDIALGYLPASKEQMIAQAIVRAFKAPSLVPLDEEKVKDVIRDQYKDEHELAKAICSKFGQSKAIKSLFPYELRDYLAGQVLMGIAANPYDKGSNEELAKKCYAMADAMLKERENNAQN